MKATSVCVIIATAFASLSSIGGCAPEERYPRSRDTEAAFCSGRFQVIRSSTDGRQLLRDMTASGIDWIHEDLQAWREDRQSNRVYFMGNDGVFIVLTCADEKITSYPSLQAAPDDVRSCWQQLIGSP